MDFGTEIKRSKFFFFSWLIIKVLVIAFLKIGNTCTKNLIKVFRDLATLGASISKLKSVFY